LKGISFWGHKAAKQGIFKEEVSFFVAKSLFTTITNADFSKPHFIKYIMLIQIMG
jgi:hydroxylamine reductase